MRRTEYNKVDADAHDSVYADEAALPSFAQMQAAQEPQLLDAPQLWSDRQSLVAQLGQKGHSKLPGGRTMVEVSRSVSAGGVRYCFFLPQSQSVCNGRNAG